MTKSPARSLRPWGPISRGPGARRVSLGVLQSFGAPLYLQSSPRSPPLLGVGGTGRQPAQRNVSALGFSWQREEQAPPSRASSACLVPRGVRAPSSRAFSQGTTETAGWSEGMLVWKSPLQLPTAYAKGPEDKKSGGTPRHSPLLTVEKVGQVSQALLCSFHHSLRLSGSLLPNPALSCSTSVILKLSSVPSLTVPPLSWACLVSHGTLILDSRGHTESRRTAGQRNTSPSLATAPSAQLKPPLQAAQEPPGALWHPQKDQKLMSTVYITGGSGAAVSAGLVGQNDGVTIALSSSPLPRCP